MNLLRTAAYGILLLTSFALLTACGGGGGGGDSSSDTNVSRANGIWIGSIHNNSTTLDYDTMALVYEGEMRAITLQTGEIDVGTITVSDDNFTANVTAYDMDLGVLGTARITGMLGAKSYISGTYTASNGVTGSITADYSPYYDRPSSLNAVAGIWSWTEAGYTMTVTVQNDGSFLGSDTYGCVMSGTISILDSSVNMYRMNAGVTSCSNPSANGSYEGLLTLFDYQAGTNNGMVFSINSSSVVVYGGLVKQ